MIRAFVLSLVLAVCGCSAWSSEAGQIARQEGDELACIDSARTLAESRACRARVRAHYADAGKDGAP